MRRLFSNSTPTAQSVARPSKSPLHSFTQVPNYLIYSSVSPTAKSVYCLVKQRCDVKGGTAYFSILSLSNYLGLSPKTVGKAVQLLIKLSVLDRKSVGRKHPRAKLGRASVYSVNSPETWRLQGYAVGADQQLPEVTA